MIRVAVIGAGMAGLTLAREIGASAEVVVFEKSRGYGGRMATRLATPYEFDHGAQFFTAKSEAFGQFLQPFIAAGQVARWDAEFVEIDGGRVINRRSWADGPAHYVSLPRITILAKKMAADLDVRLETRVERVDSDQSGWRLRAKDGRNLGRFDWVISAIPAAQACELLPTSFAGHDEMSRKSMLGCFSLMLGFEREPALDWQAAFVRNADISWISVNNSKPGRADACSLLVHSTNRWAETNFELGRDEVIAHLLQQLRQVTGVDLSRADHVGLQRWRYANIGRQKGAVFLLDRNQKLAAIGDWCIHGRIESAYTSARQLARQLGQDF